SGHEGSTPSVRTSLTGSDFVRSSATPSGLGATCLRSSVEEQRVSTPRCRGSTPLGGSDSRPEVSRLSGEGVLRARCEQRPHRSVAAGVGVGLLSEVRCLAAGDGERAFLLIACRWGGWGGAWCWGCSVGG